MDVGHTFSMVGQLDISICRRCYCMCVIEGRPREETRCNTPGLVTWCDWLAFTVDDRSRSRKSVMEERAWAKAGRATLDLDSEGSHEGDPPRHVCSGQWRASPCSTGHRAVECSAVCSVQCAPARLSTRMP